jgi:hypothetical protein
MGQNMIDIASKSIAGLLVDEVCFARDAQTRADPSAGFTPLLRIPDRVDPTLVHRRLLLLRICYRCYQHNQYPVHTHRDQANH